MLASHGGNWKDFSFQSFSLLDSSVFQIFELICLQRGEDPYKELGINTVMMVVLMIEMTTLKIIKADIYQARSARERAQWETLQFSVPPHQPWDWPYMITFSLQMRNWFTKTSIKWFKRKLLRRLTYGPWNSPGQNTSAGSHSRLQGIFPTQGSNPGLPHSRQILYQLSHQGSLISLTGKNNEASAPISDIRLALSSFQDFRQVTSPLWTLVCSPFVALWV